MAVDQFQLPFREQLAYLKQKKTLPTATYKDIDSRQHDKAFVVAGAMKADLLSDLHRIVIDAAESGQSFNQFQDNFDDVLGKHGWLNDADKEYKAWRANVIYQTNLRTSHAAGRYKQMTDPEVLKRRPYWRYRHNSVENPRIQHQRWNNLILPADAQFWKINFPPNGYGCQCTVEAINERQLKAMGKTQPDDEPSYDDDRTDFLSAPGANWYPDLNKYPAPIATSYVKENMHDGIFDRWLSRIATQVAEEMTKQDYKGLAKEKVIQKLRKLDQGEQYPIAVIPEAFQKLLGITTQVLMFSEYDAIKQAFSRLGDPNFSFDAYRDVQYILQDPNHIIRETIDGNQQMTVWLQRGKNSYMAVLQQTKTGNGLFLKSFRLASGEREVKRALKNGELLYEKSDT
ncbi:phage head morphogenesis protein [Acinetobacter ursingii]|uniref:phage head morphogenesis protein n=1 Tax=Acinetobacter ursingii TaxID=108980 RepID=UPI0021CD892C|nr:phage head morphogenesis protein [Acinetobacter ursingii]MCU4601869.1 phage head morphogenesis protein [Acinetobacter ursingii]